MSKLILEIATEEVKSGNKGVRDQVRHIGNKFINAVEVTAQEAVYLVLHVHLVKFNLLIPLILMKGHFYSKLWIKFMSYLIILKILSQTV